MNLWIHSLCTHLWVFACRPTVISSPTRVSVRKREACNENFCILILFLCFSLLCVPKAGLAVSLADSEPLGPCPSATKGRALNKTQAARVNAYTANKSKQTGWYPLSSHLYLSLSLTHTPEHTSVCVHAYVSHCHLSLSDSNGKVGCD